MEVENIEPLLLIFEVVNKPSILALLELLKIPELFILIELILDVIFDEDIMEPPTNNILFLSIFKPILIFPVVYKSPLKLIFSIPV